MNRTLNEYDIVLERSIRRACKRQGANNDHPTLPGGGSLYLFLAFFAKVAFLILETVFTVFFFFDAIFALVTGFALQFGFCLDKFGFCFNRFGFCFDGLGFALTGLDFALTVLGFALTGLVLL